MPKSTSSQATSGSYYAVRVGRQAGIYRTWDECNAEVKSYPGAKFKKFKDLAEAQAFAGPQAPLFPSAGLSAVAAAMPGRSNRPAPYAVSGGRYIKCIDTTGDWQRALRVVGGGEGKSAGRVGKAKRAKKSATHDTAPPPLAGETADKIVVYTDGASSNNGKRGARAGVGVYFGHYDPRNVSESLAGPRQTNQRAELMAILRAIEAASSNGGTDKNLVICTDSMYSINCVSVWHHKWANCGWVNSTGKEVENQDLIKGILQKTKEYQGSVQYVHVRGHAGIHGNEEADRLAVRGASNVGSVFQ
ncbi:Ribonuclease H1 [Coemansia sp. BCRC 34301]|nr:Ribonuclease H1 [Coemansia sp. BCRC 34301]